MTTIVLLTISNIFMTIAWYGHLKFKQVPLFTVIVLSWLIAFMEYCFQVPANRIGHSQFTAAQLKTIQEVITLMVFVGFAWLVLGEKLTWNYAVSFGLILLAVYFATAFKPTAGGPNSRSGLRSSSPRPGSVIAHATTATACCPWISSGTNGAGGAVMNATPPPTSIGAAAMNSR